MERGMDEMFNNSKGRIINKSGVRSLESGVRSLELEVRSLESGVKYLRLQTPDF
jgi:hypothetical protein